MSNAENSMKETILAAISEVTGRPIPDGGVNDDASVYELGIDSMSLVELIFKLEAELEIDIPLAELNESIFESLAALVTYLESRKQAMAGADSLAPADAAK